MIEIKKIVEEFFKEAKQLYFTEENFKISTDSSPIPENKVIEDIIEKVFWVSLSTEEGTFCKPRLLYFSEELGTQKAFHRFKKPQKLNHTSLRKLSPSLGKSGYLVWVNNAESNEPEIVGILLWVVPYKYRNFIITVEKPGVIDIAWNGQTLIRTQSGHILGRPATRKPNVNAILERIDSFLEPPYSWDKIKVIIRTIASNSHGGALWIARSNAELKNITVIYPTLPDSRINSLKQPDPDSMEWLQNLGNLASVDGAILIDSKLQLLGFGAFISCDCGDELVNEIEIPYSFKKISQIGGGRHQSAASFVFTHAPAAAIVVSEDGGISLIWADDKRTFDEGKPKLRKEPLNLLNLL